MKNYICLPFIFLLCSTVLAGAPISYDEIITSGAGSANENNATGREVTIRNAKKSMFGYIVKAEDAISFICRSGDRSLVKSSKLQNVSFKGVTEFAVDHDGMTTWNLKNCERVGSRAP